MSEVEALLLEEIRNLSSVVADLRKQVQTFAEQQSPPASVSATRAAELLECSRPEVFEQRRQGNLKAVPAIGREARLDYESVLRLAEVGPAGAPKKRSRRRQNAKGKTPAPAPPPATKVII